MSRRNTRAAALLVLAATLFAGEIAAPALAGATTVTARPNSTSHSYPYANQNPNEADPWGAAYRQCTSFASWWLSRHGVFISSTSTLVGPRGSARLGDAGHWDAAAIRAGFAVSTTPAVGAIAQWHPGEESTWSVPGGYAYELAGAAGHVGVVRSVNSDGTAIIQDYNGAIPLGLHTYRGRAPRYLLIKP